MVLRVLGISAVVAVVAATIFGLFIVPASAAQGDLSTRRPPSTLTHVPAPSCARRVFSSTRATAAMDASAYDTAGSDFTIQQSLAAVGPMVAAGVSGLSAASLGYAGHFALAAALQMAIVAAVALSAGLRRSVEARAAT